MNDIIKAAAEKKYPDDPKTFAHIENYRQEFIDNVIEGIQALQSNGLELLDVRGGDTETVVSISNKHSQYAGKISENGYLNAIREALAIGASRERDKAMKFAEWVCHAGYDYIRSDKQWLRWGTMDEEEAVVSKSTSELWSMAEAEGVFTLNIEG